MHNNAHSIVAVGLRVDLSSYKSFTDMILALNESVHHCRCNGHFPFTTVADEVSHIEHSILYIYQ